MYLKLNVLIVYNMITYILRINNYCTIGKTANLEKRLRAYSTHSPKIDLVRVFKGDYEKELHEKFANRRVDRREWFRLSYDDISSIEFEEISPYLTRNLTGVNDATWYNPFQRFTYINLKVDKKIEASLSDIEMSILRTLIGKLEPYTNKLPYSDKTSIITIGEDLQYNRNKVKSFIDKLFKLNVIKNHKEEWIMNPHIGYVENIHPDVIDLFSKNKSQ